MLDYILKRPLLLHLILFIFPLFLYLETLTYDFAYDDILHIRHNPVVSRYDFSLDGFFAVFAEPTAPGNLYRPAATLSYKLNFLFSGLNPAPYHLVNVLLYAACCLLVFHLAASVLGNRIVAFYSSLLFAVHPIHTEAVANVIGRAELLSAVCGLAALLFFREYYRRGGASEENGLAIYGGVFFLSAVLSKESAYTFLLLIPPAMVMNQPRRERRLSRIAAVTAAALIAPAVIGLLMRARVLGHQFVIQTDLKVWPENPLFHLPFEARLIPAIKILGDYLALLLAPVGLSADYSRMPDDLMREVFSAAGALGILLTGAVALTAATQRRIDLRYFGVWFFLSFLLTCNVLTPIGTIMGERLAFTPSVGFIIFIVALIADVRERNPLPPDLTGALCAIPLAAFSLLSLERMPVWRNNGALFYSTLADAPQSPKALYNYAVYLITEKHDPDAARFYLNKTLALCPEHLLSMRALADIALEKKEYWKVEYWYREILRVEPNDGAVRTNLERLKQFKLELKESTGVAP